MLKKLGSFEKEYNNNKILNLKIAAEFGLKIPKTIVTNNSSDLEKFIIKGKQYITKSVNAPLNLVIDKFIYYNSGTIQINLEKIPTTFSPSLIQEYIEKQIEIRIFFIGNKFFSMAIFSQDDTKTKIDYRNYNIEKPNRMVPFILPSEIKKKVIKFLKKQQLNTGSLDFILTPNNEFYFLEVNPMGQFDWLSESCNYNIEKHIAKYLINQKHES